MKKGISMLVGAVLIVVLAVSVVGSVVFWMKRTTQQVKKQTANETGSEIRHARTTFYINRTWKSGGEIKVQIINNGKFNIDSGRITVYYNGEKRTAVKESESDPASPHITPGESARFSFTP